jgi:hypothetical protein
VVGELAAGPPSRKARQHPREGHSGLGWAERWLGKECCKNSRQNLGLDWMR